MLLESIKEIKNGRIVVRDSVTKDEDYSRSTLYVYKLGSTFKGKLHANPTIFPVVSLPTKEEINKWAKSNGFVEVRFMDSKDSTYTKAEYQTKLTDLQNQLQQAKQLGKLDEAQEIQKEIDDLETLESGIQDADNYEFTYECDVEGKHKTITEGGFATKEEMNKKLEKVKNETTNFKLITKDSVEAKITDLTEKAKKARAQGYAADQYDIEIEKLKALDKKTKDETFEQNYKGIKIYSEPNNSRGKRFYWVHPKTGQNINWNTLIDVKEDIDSHKELGYLDKKVKDRMSEKEYKEETKMLEAQIKTLPSGKNDPHYQDLVNELNRLRKEYGEFPYHNSTKDSPRDNIEKQIDQLEDELEKEKDKNEKEKIQAQIDQLEEKLSTEDSDFLYEKEKKSLTEELEDAKKNGNTSEIKKIEASLKELEDTYKKANDSYDEVDWATIDPLTDKGKEILASMKKQYGDEQGEKIFYTSRNAGKITGIDSK